MNLSVVRLLGVLLIVAACNDGQISSPYAELLSRPPYAPLTDSIRERPDDPELYYRRGTLLMRNNNQLPAIADLDHAWKLQQREAYAIALGNALADAHADTLTTFLRHAAAIFPNSLAIHLSLIQSYADARQTKEALAVSDSFLQRQPQSAGILMIKADLLQEINDTAGSIAMLERARAYAPANEELCYSLAFKYAQGKSPRCVPLCDSLIRADSADRKPEPFYFKGVYYSNTGQSSKAMALFDEAIAADYSFLDAYMEKGKLLYDDGKFPVALKVFGLATTVSPTFADAYFWQAKCEDALGKKDEAALDYDRAYGLDKSLTEARDAAARLRGR